MSQQSFKGVIKDQKGITGLETAIVFIAFVVVSSVFAFAALSTGLFTTDRAKETIHAGLKQARSTLEIRGSLLAQATTGSTGTVTVLRFQVANAAAGEAIDMTPGRTIIKYTDTNQTDNLSTNTQFTATQVGTSGDEDSLLETGEIFEILIPPSGTLTTTLGTALGTSTQFTLEVIQPTGATLYLQRTTPVAFAALENLQ